MREELAVARVTCNKCGVSEDLKDLQFYRDYTTIIHHYGYGSKRDGDTLESHVCEDCMDEFYATFKIPPQLTSSELWGEVAPRPILMDEEIQEDNPEPGVQNKDD